MKLLHDLARRLGFLPKQSRIKSRLINRLHIFTSDNDLRSDLASTIRNA